MKLSANYLSLLLYLYILLKSVRTAEVLQSLQGVVGAENYTYFRLTRPGRLMVELVSLSGDADLYISDELQNPTAFDYKQQSSSCGSDVLEIPASYDRPVGIGIYGYPSFEVSKFTITIYDLPQSDTADYETLSQQFYSYDDAAYAAGYEDVKRNVKYTTDTPPSSQTGASEEGDESEGSLFWQILIDVLKLLLEAVLN